MANYTVTTADDTNNNTDPPTPATTASVKGAVAASNASTANDNIILANDITLTPQQTTDIFGTITPTNGANMGTLRIRSVQPMTPVDPPLKYTLTLTSAVIINDVTPTTAQPSFTIGPARLQIGDGVNAANNGSITGNLRADDGGDLIFNNTTNTTYTGTLSVEDEDNGLFNAKAGTTLTLDGSAGTLVDSNNANGPRLAIRASQGTGAASAYELEFGGAGDGVISGVIGDGGLASAPGNLDKTGTGTWTFSGTNTYVGTTTVEEGTLVITNSAGLGGNGNGSAAAGTKVVDGATLALQGGISIGAEALTLGAKDDDGGAGSDDDAPGLLNVSGNNTYGGEITLDGDATIASNAGTLTLTRGVIVGGVDGMGNPVMPALTLDGDGDGVIAGGIASSISSVTKEGDGTWTFNGANSYDGTTTIEEGTLAVTNAAGLGTTAAGTIVEDGATLALSGGITITGEALTLAGEGEGDDDDAAGALNSTGDNTFTGAITLAADALVVSESGSLTLSGAISGAGAVDDMGTSFNPGLTVGGDGDGVVSGTIDADVGTVTKNGDGFWTLSGTNAYIGTTTVEEGTLIVSNSSALGATTAGTVVRDGATLSLDAGTATGASITIGDALTLSGEGAEGDDEGEGAAGALSNETGANIVSGNITLAADSTIKSEGGTLTLSGTISGAFGLTLDGEANGTISGVIGNGVTTVTKEGEGTWSLSASNTYAGGTFLNEGRLELGTLTSAGTGAITFGDDEQTLQIDASGTLANTLTGFEEDDTIDLRTINADGATARINGNKVTITETQANGGDSVTLTFDEVPDDFSAILASDGQGGTTLMFDDDGAPDTPEAPMLTAASDTGISSTDGVTRDTTPTFTGTAEAGSTVTFYTVDSDGDVIAKIGTATADQFGNYSFTSTALVDGSYDISVTSTGDNGIQSELSEPKHITIDTSIAAPSLALKTDSDSGRSATDGITNVKTPVITGTAEPNSVVTLYDGTKLLGTTLATSQAVVGPSGTFSFKSPTLADGVHNISAVATDAAGNFSGSSAVVSVTVDTKAPTAPTAPVLTAASDSGVSQTDKVTNVQTPTFTGTTEAGARITLYDGTKMVGTVLAGSNGSYSVTSQTLASGVHNIRVTATDAAGNVSAMSAATAIAIDTTAPTVPAKPAIVMASDTGKSKTDGITSDSTPSLVGRAEVGATVKVYDGDGTTVLGTAVAGSNGIYIVTPTEALSDGAHTLRITATDKAGNASVRSQGVSVTVDTAAPAAPAAPTLDATSDSGTQGDNITKDNTPTLTGTAENGATVTLYDGTKAVGTALANASTGAYSITSSALTNGQHSLTVKATDAAGNVSAASSATSVTIDTIAPAAPKVALANDTGTSGTDRITSDPTLTVTAEQGATLQYSTDGKTYSDDEPVFTTDGVKRVYVRATDAAGNTGAAGSLTFTLDTTNPDVDITSAGGAVTTAKQTVSGTGEAGSTVTLTDNGVTSLGTATVAANGKWSKAVTLSSGANDITASAVDKAGNEGATDSVAYTYTPAMARQASSHNSMVQAMSTMTGSPSAAMTPSAPSSGSEGHQLAAAHA